MKKFLFVALFMAMCFSAFCEIKWADAEENDEGISVYLPLYKRSGDTYEICTDSLRKLNSSSVNIVRINGKREV